MSVSIGSLVVGEGNPLVLIAGPCVVESRDIAFRTAEEIHRVADRLGIPVIFKSSYKKANRTSARSFVTIGMDKALAALGDVKRQFGMPVLSDIHQPDEARVAAAVLDVLQIPAFLCRQTDLLQAAGETGKAVNIKKGQFLAPEDMIHVAEKVAATGNRNILLTERGTTFGYHNLVVDMRGLVIMRRTGYPVVFDATHSVQVPGGRSFQSGGEPEFILPLARAGVAAGCDALFVETHPDPRNAKSDAASQLPLDNLEDLVRQVWAIHRALQSSGSS